MLTAAECDNLAIWGYRPDRDGDVYGAVILRRPGNHHLGSLSDQWLASVELTAESVLQETAPYTDAGDLSCLNP